MIYEFAWDPGQIKHQTELYRSYEIYDPDNNTWTCPTDRDPNKHMAHRRAGHAAALLTDGTVLVVDGYTSEIYDPKTDSWTFTGDVLNFPRSFPSATLLKDEKGRVLVTGGGPINGELYQPPSTLIRSSVPRSDRKVSPDD